MGWDRVSGIVVIVRRHRPASRVGRMIGENQSISPFCSAVVEEVAIIVYTRP